MACNSSSRPYRSMARRIATISRFTLYRLTELPVVGKGHNKTHIGLYTKKGRPLQISGDRVYSKSGIIIGRIKRDKVYGANGQYLGTIVGDRLVYRSSQSGTVSGSFSAGNRGGSGMGNRGGSGIWGEEPNIPD
jgi:hypothetical protein